MKTNTSKTILVSGVSSGFGLLIVNQLIKKGHTVIGCLRGGHHRGVEIYKNQTKAIEEKKLLFLDLDLLVDESIIECAKNVKTICPDGIDILINNAGMGILGPIELQSIDLIRKQTQVNFLGPTLLTKELIPLIKKGTGKILNVTSMVGFCVFPFYGSYAASKHAFDACSEALYYDLSPLGIQVCTIEPGGFKTNFNQNITIADNQNTNISHYNDRLTRFKKFLDFIQEKAEKDPIIVVNQIIRLSEANKIPPKIRIGIDAHINWISKKIFPDNLRIQFNKWLYERFFF